jgi:PAS domain-containing protein
VAAIVREQYPKARSATIDVTEQKVAEQSLRELNHTLEEKTTLLQSREELLKTFVKSVPAGVAMLDCAIESPAICVEMNEGMLKAQSYQETFSGKNSAKRSS